MPRFIYDIETNGLLDQLDRVHCITAINLDTGERLAARPDQCEDLARTLYESDGLIGHNIWNFDNRALAKVYDWWDRVDDRRDFDTMIDTRLIWPTLWEDDERQISKGVEFPKELRGRHSLKAWGMRLGVLKDDYEGGWEEFNESMFTYAQQDVEVTLALWKWIEQQDYSPVARQLEQDVARIMSRQEAEGFPFDTEAAESLLRSLQSRQAEIHAELAEAFPPWEVKTPFIPKANNKTRGYVKGELTYKVKEIVFNPASRDHIADRLITLHGWEPEVMTDGGKPKVDETVLSGLPYPEAKLLAENFLIEKRLGQLVQGSQGWLKKVKNGRIHGRVTTNGAVTGRATHQSPNLGQVPGVNAPYGKQCRSLFTAPEGRVLLGCDASGLELRCLAHYMSLWDNGAYGDEILNGDIHTANQKAAGLETRNQAKTFIYAWLFGAGNKKIGSIVGGGEQKGAYLKSKFLKAVPAIKELSTSVKQRAKAGYLYGLDRRKIHVRSEHAALNTLLQGAGAAVCKRWIVEMDDLFKEKDLDVRWHAWVHDEVQLSCPPEIAEEVGKTCIEAIKRTEKFFGFRMPLDGEFNVGKNWAETH